jgi:hypothetical protein
MKEIKRVVDTASFIESVELYKDYKQYKRHIPKKYQVNRSRRLSKITNELFRSIANNMLEAEGGVAIRGLGYFFIQRSEKKRMLQRKLENGELEPYFNIRHNMRRIAPMYMPPQRQSFAFYSWSFDDSFSITVKLKLRENLKKGMKYKAYPFTVTKLKLI